ncbi:MAG: 3,4-dehydroadipyl-CoA semialdehyde dehydrogenase [Spongiibacteraceae bacterium]|nr:3,4-dehydroadipyl-CoA semialdehyde dehydrogenase [Spongiibacteraceae bacterium]
MKLQNYIEGCWVEGLGQGSALHDPVSGKVLAYAGSEGVDLVAALAFARERGNPALQALSYEERGQLLTAAADVLNSHRDKYITTALENSGNTAADAQVDIDGGIGTLKYYAALARGLGDTHFLSEPGLERLSRNKAFQAVHILTPLKGVAIHINAFNFPSWGLWEKAAVSLLSGVPVFSKPATTACLLSYQMLRDVIEAQIFPTGALSMICGGGHHLMDHVEAGDTVLFTGSADTATVLRSHPRVISSGVRFNVEADSVNMTLLGEDVEAGSGLFDAFIKEVLSEMTTKAGQKCTAIRRIFVPSKQLDAVSDALSAALNTVVVGDPREDGVQMGPLMNKAQQQAAWDGIAILKREADVVFGDDPNFSPLTADSEQGCFVQPTLLKCADPLNAARVHDTEVFGPVATLVPYTTEIEAWDLAARGGGSLACSVFSDDEQFAMRAVLALSCSHGRVLVVNESVREGHSGHGVVMPQCIHGGPGRAGGGEELGGLRGLKFYHQRTAIQADVEHLEALCRASAKVQ